MFNARYLLISTVAQPTGCPGSNVCGLHMGPCKRQEEGKDGEGPWGCKGGEGGKELRGVDGVG